MGPIKVSITAFNLKDYFDSEEPLTIQDAKCSMESGIHSDESAEILIKQSTK